MDQSQSNTERSWAQNASEVNVQGPAEDFEAWTEAKPHDGLDFGAWAQPADDNDFGDFE